VISCIVVDDEQLILDELVAFLKGAGVSVIGAYDNPHIALEAIIENGPDVVFLDVEMPEINGIELAKRIRENCSETFVVFVTAYKEYALNAFGVSAIHYLLKPVNVDGIKEAIERISKMKKMNEILGDVDSGVLIKSNISDQKRISFRIKKDIIIVDLEDILFFASENSITFAVTKQGKYKTKQNLTYWEAQLKDYDFVRCHKAYVVNVNYIYRMVHVLGEYKELVLKYGDIRVPISRRKVNEIKNWLGVNKVLKKGFETGLKSKHC